MKCAAWILDDYNDWTCKLRALRTDRGLRQEDVIRRMFDIGLRLTRSQYAAIEGGRSVVKYVHLVALAKVFRVSLATMITLPNYEVEE